MAQPIWSTAAVLGSFPSLTYFEVALIAVPVLPGTSVTYALISGTLPTGISITAAGLISGTPTLVTEPTTGSFTVRATDNLGNLRDRTFTMTIFGSALPLITTPAGTLLAQLDSIWTQIQIEYTNPDPNNIVVIELKEGLLPPGLEINESGLISGYPLPPVDSVSLPTVTTTATSTSSNTITCFSTNAFYEGRAVVFTLTAFGSIIEGATYYIKNIISPTSFTISTTQFGPTFSLTDDTGLMTVTLPNTSVGEPTIRTYTFTLRLNSPLGGNFVEYRIDVINQHTPAPRGPGKAANTRVPSILNTRPLSFDTSGPYYGYYILPPIPPTQYARIGTIDSGNYFSYKVLGYDFDGNTLTYSYSGLPAGLVGDPVTGWITGILTLALPGLSEYTFKVSVAKTDYPAVYSDYFNFSFELSYDVSGVVTWLTNSDLGTLFNGAISNLKVEASSDISLEYRISSGTLPPNLSLAADGEILGRVPDQPTSVMLVNGDTSDFTFTVEAFSSDYPMVSSLRTFTMTILQQYDQPTDIVNCKAAPSIQDRLILDSLLTNTSLIPDEYLYRPNDTYFGKASSVVYAHMYGVYAADLTTYLQAVMINHYWRNIILGEIKTAVARNASGEIIYEVVYSEVIDNIENHELSGTTTGDNDDDPPYVIWDTPINLNLGPWYTSITDIFTSYELVLGQQFYTSLTPGFVRTVYPNSLLNMRNRVASVVGQEYNSNLLPLWMTSQQANGGTLGYTQAWVICYTKPGFADVIKNNIQPSNPKLLNPAPQNPLWPHTLNEINFEIDRFTVDKSETYDYVTSLELLTEDEDVYITEDDTPYSAELPPGWSSLPSAVPTPNPLDSEDFYVLFPRQTIIPTILE